jgi:hypothetical protein
MEQGNRGGKSIGARDHPRKYFPKKEKNVIVR